MRLGFFFIGASAWTGISKLVEECGEVVQVCGKLIGAEGRTDHWDGTDLLMRLQEEIADVLAAAEFVIVKNKLDWEYIKTRKREKMAKFEGWHEGETVV